MRLGDAWAPSPRSSYSIRRRTRPGPRPISTGPRHIQDLSTSSAGAVTATEEESHEHGNSPRHRDSRSARRPPDHRSELGADPHRLPAGPGEGGALDGSG